MTPDSSSAEPSGHAPASPNPILSAVRQSPIARLPTGVKLFLILSAALLPLALIAVVATLQTTRVADAEARSRLRIAANESARAIATELIGDTTALRVALDALGSDPADLPSCARAQGVFAQQASTGARFEIVDRRGRLLCGEELPPGPRVSLPGEVRASIVPDRGVLLTIVGARPGVTATAFFPEAFLRRLGRPVSRATSFSSALVLGEAALPLEPDPDGGALRRTETLRTEVGIAGLVLTTSVRSAPVTSSLIVALMLPMVMWAAAAGIAWFVVDRLLLRPLRHLRTSVAAFTPGKVIDSRATSLPSQEIRALGETFRAISETVAAHEAGLEEGLRRQTKLTREVHHRVKNNLQVISSLIAFHARGARSADATAAYASIQRRVDALAVVHRHHFAELEEHRGLNLRTMIGELSSNIRATASEQAQTIGLTLDIDAFLVNQDVAVALAFLVTEMIELAGSCDPAAQIRVSVKPSAEPDRAVLRVISRALVDGDALRELAGSRYGRVMEGLSRQLRSKLHHDPLTGAYEIAFAVLGRD
ncbi:sensor histidine kinase [Sphingomonas sp. KR1UV-12]|uniref:histidine kinase n=1 Tax=Sphingomonas aurea TaxID=3063994 RepID=A0ABT9EFA6_9SPHN|nr:sensor histidine kinase [Sphingomonas sp. KR1UV-12]MDP1025656.1 sensor histidine kinase [Sphingomonas sp. KR1UV-12]